MNLKQNNLINRYISILALCLLLGVLLIVCIGENDIFPAYVLPLTPLYTIKAGMCILTICIIPLSIKLLFLQRIRQQISNNPQSYFYWAICRLLMLYFIIYLNLTLYYLLPLDVSMLYLASIAGVAILYIWPSKARQNREMQISSK